MILMKITFTLALLLLVELQVIQFIGGDCDTDTKEWLLIFTIITFAAFIGCALWLIWV
jgi:hypothetical protein